MRELLCDLLPCPASVTTPGPPQAYGLLLACPIVLGIAFLLGAVPFAWIVVRLLKGIDVRTIGSGNVGATNASRAFDPGAARIAVFALIYLLDAGKGFVAVLLSGPLLAWGVAAGACAVLGHVFTPFLRFRGGKGVATATGVMFALDWQVTAFALGVFLIVRVLTGIVFLGSLALGLALPVAAIVLHRGEAFGDRLPVTILCLVFAVFLFWTHRSNLKKHFARPTAGTP